MMADKPIQVLLIALHGQRQAIREIFRSNQAQCEFTVCDEPEEIERQLQDPEKWSLVLVSLFIFNTSRFRRILSARKHKLHASVIVMLAEEQHLSVDAVYHHGADDVVDIGNPPQIRVVAQREITNALNRRTLQALQRRLPARPTAGHVVPGPSAVPMPAPQGSIYAAVSATTPVALPAERRAHILELIKRQRMTLHYQTIINLQDSGDDTAMYEVYVRLVDDDGILIYPHDFWQIAREAGMLPVIDQFVIEHALRALENVQARARPHTRLFLKLAEQSIVNPVSFDNILRTLSSTTVSNGSLVIELVKPVYWRQKERVHLLHDVLKTHAHSLLFEAGSFDDCQQMAPFSALLGYLRLNQPFVDGVITDSEKRDKLGALIQCALGNGMEIIAGWVEDAEVVPLLHSIGVTHVQGNFIGPPGDDLAPSSLRDVAGI